MEVVESFYGVYLLYCLNERYKGRTYIGYTTDPNRRIKQHNGGRSAGGAARTSNRGPWAMTLIVHGFPNNISALRFEWAWQHPKASVRLRHVPAKRAREKKFDFCLRVLSAMLQTGPWRRLPLTVRWLRSEFQRPLPGDIIPPPHMPVTQGIVKPVKVKPSSSETDPSAPGVLCTVCKSDLLPIDSVACLSPECTLVAHLACLADAFLAGSSALLPVEGICPACGVDLLWGDVIRKRNGCYEYLDNRGDGGDAEHWTDCLSQV